LKETKVKELFRIARHIRSRKQNTRLPHTSLLTYVGDEAVLGKEREYQLFILAVLEFRLEKLFPSKYKVWELLRFSSEQLKAAFRISTAVTDAKKLSVLLI
jgi:hypothetical protein